MIINLNMYM